MTPGYSRLRMRPREAPKPIRAKPKTGKGRPVGSLISTTPFTVWSPALVHGDWVEYPDIHPHAGDRGLNTAVGMVLDCLFGTVRVLHSRPDLFAQGREFCHAVEDIRKLDLTDEADAAMVAAWKLLNEG